MFLKFLLIFIVSLWLISIIRNNAHRWGLVDIPNERSTHLEHTARRAGIGFYLPVAFIFPIFYFDLMLSCSWPLLAVLLVFIVGVLDDHRDTSHHTKFFVIIFSAVLLSFDNILINDLGTFFGMELSFGWFALPFTIFAVVGFTNALNLIDGLDGLAATISIVILGTFFLVGYLNEDLFMMVISGAFIASLLAFLVYNWHPASIFMGDSGSLTLGFVISMLAIKSLEYLPTVSILFLLNVVLLYLFLAAMIKRQKREC